MASRAASRLVVAAIAAGLALLALPAVAGAVEYTVTTTDDHDDKACDADCTLREAVNVAGSFDAINVPKGVYLLTLGELVVVSDHIVGAGARDAIIDGGKETRVLRAADGSSTVAGVTIQNGNGSGGAGGGVFVGAGASLTITNSTISGNTATAGGGIAAAGSLTVIGSTVSGNQASTGRVTQGGGIAAASTLAIGNTTVSGNSAADQVGAASQGGGIYAGGAVNATNVTIAANTATTGGGLYLDAPPVGAAQQISNAIVGANNGGSCAGAGLKTDVTHNNLAFDKACLFAGTADRMGLNPQLGLLDFNGGQTQTHALLPSSPAINQGAGCAKTDQRGVPRPQPAKGACDIGAYEYRAPTLTVVMGVINDAGGKLGPADFTVRVLTGGRDVTGSPAAGSPTGRLYTLVAGTTYVVGALAVPGYTRAITGDCDAKGIILLEEGQNRTCTITANDIAPTLKVITTVTNDGGGVLDASHFVVHVAQGGQEATGSPQPGSTTGTTYRLTAGSYGVFADAVAGYATGITGDCAATGDITLALGDVKTCTITADDGAAALALITKVVNDNGGTLGAGAFMAHVRSGAADVEGSPQVGDAGGTPYLLPAGKYSVSLEPRSGYTMKTSGDCASDGTVTLAVGESRQCTITADDVAAKLTVITAVTNDNGGTRTPAGFNVHVRKGGADVPGSPKPGSAGGTTYTLAAGSYAVATDAVTGYAVAIGGACAANGAVTLQVGEAKTCTVKPNDKLVVLSQQLPPPVPGKNVNALPKSGTVKVKLPGTDKFVELTEGEQIPLGTTVDATRGRVTIVADDGESADFYGGVFKLSQTKGKKPITVVKLVAKLSCKASGKATTAAKKRRKRRLWGDGRGRFRTRGKHSAATVVGTKWLVEDRCRSTLTRVVRGKVRVRDFVKKKTVTVKAGKRYIARAR